MLYLFSFQKPLHDILHQFNNIYRIYKIINAIC